MTNFGKSIMFSVLVFVLGVLANQNGTANGMYYKPGETYPTHVEAAIGADFNITCYMNPKAFPGKNSSSLYFVNSSTKEEVPRNNIIIANSTTIVYMVHNASEQITEYICKCGSKGILITKVYVGSRPRPVRDFRCRSYDFDYMICNFTKPPNPILTTYNVSYYNDLPNYIYQPVCDFYNNYVVCNTSLKDRYEELYSFIIESSNALVKLDEKPLVQCFNVNIFDIMIPSKPGDNIRIESLTVDSTRLAWQMINWDKYRPRGLQWEVLVQPENSTILQPDDPIREHNELYLHLNNLPYAYWRYELKLRVRVRNSTAVWSEQLIFPFRTAARRPQRPPLVQPGSFYIDSMETHITIYWKEFLPFEYNGDNFTYVATVSRNGKLLDLKPFHQEMNLAKFSWQKDSQCDFEIRSRNHMGESIEASHITVYPLSLRDPKAFTPQAIHNVYHDNNRTYTLTWSKPENITELSSFTVYWCYPKRALSNECRGSIFFKQISAEQLNTTIKQSALEDHTLNLAVSANYVNYNTGLHWTDCTMDVKSDLVKMDPDIVAATYSISVHWSVEGICPSILNGFNISYCEVANYAPDENATCLDKQIFKVADKYDKKYMILELKPFTKYKISMFMFSRLKVGKPSDPKTVTTMEGVPSPPRQLYVDDITNTSATIRWLEPSQPNGKIRKYIIMLNNENTEVNATTLSYHFENLDSFATYKVYVLAQALETSMTSNDVHFKTLTGYPSLPGMASSSNNRSIIQWRKPIQPRGRIDFYEVAVTEMRNEKILRKRISQIFGDTECAFVKVPTCVGADYKTIVEVRAVNAVSLTQKTTLPLSRTPHNGDNLQLYKDNDDLACEGGQQNLAKVEEIKRYMNNNAYMLYKSEWLRSNTISCSSSHMSKIATIALVVVGMSLGVMAALYMARKKYYKMANINCTLPAGLETYFTKEANLGFQGDFGGNLNIKDTRAIEDQWISAARMHEFNFRNEHHHLLASLGNESDYSGGGGGRGHNTGSVELNGRVISSSLETANISDNCEQRDDDNEEYEKNTLKDHLNSTTSSADSLVDSTEGSECHDEGFGRHSPLTVFSNHNTNNNGNIKSSSLQPWQNFNDHDEDSRNIPSAMTTTSGYISVQNLNPLVTRTQTNFCPPTSGYVLQEDLHNFIHNTPAITNAATQMQQSPNIPTFASGSGYTTLDDLSKLNMRSSISTPYNQLLENSNTNHSLDNDTVVASNAAKAAGISGYVTQHDLNIFAQHQQQQ